MPKGKLKAPVSTPYRGLPKPLTDKVWEKLQASLPIKLTPEDKAEINAYVMHFHIIKMQHEDAAPVEGLEELKERLHAHSKGLSDIIQRFCTSTTEETDKTLIDTLNLLTEASSPNLQKTLKQIQPTCAIIAQQLASIDFEEFSDSVLPATTALVDFLRNLKSKAEKMPAKRSPGYEKKGKSFEYKRWGMTFGPRSKNTRRFVNIVLNENFSDKQIQYAFSNT